MTKDETKNMIMYLRSFYPGFLENADLPSTIKVWHDIFKDVDKGVMEKAARNYVLSEKYMPTVSGLMEQIDMIRNPKTNDELFEMISKASRNGIYGSVDEFQKLPPECQAFVGSPSGLKELAMLDSGAMSTIVRGQFLKRVDSIRNHQNVQNGLPYEVREAIAHAKLLMEGE